MSRRNHGFTLDRIRHDLRLSSDADYELEFWVTRLDRLPHWVYVLRPAIGEAIKVGETTDLPPRVKELQTGNPYPLEVVHLLPGDKLLERAFHRRLRAARTCGEWFEGALVDEFMPYVAELSRDLRDAYRGDGQPPDYGQFVKVKTRPKRREPEPVMVRLVKPDPVMDPEEAARYRAAAHAFRASEREQYLA